MSWDERPVILDEETRQTAYGKVTKATFSVDGGVRTTYFTSAICLDYGQEDHVREVHNAEKVTVETLRSQLAQQGTTPEKVIETGAQRYLSALQEGKVVLDTNPLTPLIEERGNGILFERSNPNQT